MRFWGSQGDQAPSCRLLGFIVMTGPTCTRGCWLNLAAGCRDAEHVLDRCAHGLFAHPADCAVCTAAAVLALRGCRYSVTPEVLALHQASMCKRYGNGHVVADAMAGCGGNVIQMAMVSTHAAGQRS